MPEEKNWRAICDNHSYINGRNWKTKSEAEADFSEHLKKHPEESESDLQIEERQTAAELRISSLLHAKLFHTSLALLENASVNNFETGACVVKLPDGSAKCFQLSQKDCETLKGTYVGGKCQ